jgi:recombination DNA repair RAD52 pathway protein
MQELDPFLTNEQVEQLSGKLDPDDIEKRKGNGGRQLDYVTGEYVVSKANTIFGYAGWDLETVEMVSEHEPQPVPPSDEYPRGGVIAAFMAKVKLTVHSKKPGQGTRVRTRTGSHKSFAPTWGEACENARKAAETDGMKRAFETWGPVFGMALKDKARRDVGKNPEPKQIGHDGTRPISIAPIDEGFGDPQPTQPASNSERALTVSRPAQGQQQRPSQTNGRRMPAHMY